MEANYNKLLIRQIKRHFGGFETVPENIINFLQDINNTYISFDEDSKLLQNSIEISSQELRNAFQKHKIDAENQRTIIDKIKKAILVLNPEIEAINAEKNMDNDSNYLFDSLLNLIEERKKAEEEILKLSKAVEQNNASIVITDVNGLIEYVNPKFCILTGYTKEEVLGQNPRILKSVNTSKEYSTKLWETIIAGKEWTGELQNIKKNGELFWETASISPIFNENKQITHFIAIKEDITQKKEAEAEKIKQTGLITSLLDSIPDIIFFKDINGIYLGCNPPFAQLVGKDKNQIINKTDYDIFSKEVADVFRFFDNEMLKEKKPKHNEEWVTYPDGKKILLDTLKTPYWASDGSLIGILGISRDITIRKEAEEAIRSSSQKFEAIISASPDGIGMAGIDGKIQLMSEKLATMHGFSSDKIDEYIGKSIFEFIDASNHELLSKNLQNLIQGNKNNKISEYLALKKDGTKFYSDVNSTVLYDKNGHPSSILFVERDITERKLAEENLQNERTLFRTIIDLIPDAVYVKDIEGKKILANPKEVELLGMNSESDIIGITDYNLLPDFEAKFSQSQDMKVIATGEALMNIESTLTDKKGKQHWLLGSKVPLKDIHGNITGIVGVTHDISDRKKAEDELKQLTTRLELATRAGGVGVWELDIKSGNLYWDEQMFELYGLDKNIFDNAYYAWQNNLHPEDKARADEEIKLAINGEKEFNTEFRIVHPDNSTHNIRALATVLYDDKGEAIKMIGTNWDITAQKESEKNLMNYTTQIEMKNLELDMALTNSEQATAHAYAMAAEAEMANKSKSIFLANMSHEIRTPLNAIIGFSQLLNRDSLLNQQQKDYNLSIIRAGEHLLALINEILELSKIEAGKITLNYIHIDLHELIDDIRLIFKESAKTKNIDFNLYCDENTPRYTVADESKLRQIFVNLIGNALKFTDEGSINVNVNSERTENNEIKLIVEIKDTGCGIDDNEINSLFKHFVQTSSGIKKGSGTGLGLALSRELAVLMGGDISVKSTKGKGSIFTFYVILKIGNMEAVVNENHKKIIRLADNQKKYKILVVDDKEENLKVAVSLLQIIGFETLEAINGLDGIEKFEDWNPDLILMDMRMPVMDGYEATCKIKATDKGKHTPIVAITASSFEEERKKTEAIGMDGYIRKPFRENELFNTIGKILNIEYIYEDESGHDTEKYIDDTDALKNDIDLLDDELKLKIMEAIDFADFDKLIELISDIEIDNKVLAQQLKTHAYNYEYDYLQKLLNKK